MEDAVRAWALGGGGESESERVQSLKLVLKAALLQDPESMDSLAALLGSNKNAAGVQQAYSFLGRFYQGYTSDMAMQNLQDWFRLLASATTCHATADDKGSVGVAHVIWPCTAKDGCEVTPEGDGAIRISGLRMRVSAPGSFWVQATVGGVASQLADAPVVVEQCQADGDWRQHFVQVLILIAFGGA